MIGRTKKMRFLAKLSAIAAATVGATANPARPAEWSLVGREGACMPLSILAKKGPEFRDIEGPYQLVEKLRAAGHKAEIKEHKAANQPAVEVRVPGRNLYVMFVKTDTCAVQAPGKKK